MMEIDFETCADVYQKCIVYQRYERQNENMLKSKLEGFIDKFRKNRSLI